MPFISKARKRPTKATGAKVGERRRRKALRDAAGNSAELERILARQAQVLGTTVDKLLTRLGDKNLDLLLQEIDWVRDWQAPLKAELAAMVRRELVRTANGELERLGMKLRFDMDNPYANRYAETQAAKLVVEITQQTRDGLQAVVASGFRQRRTVDWIAKELRAVSGFGLNSRLATAVTNYRTKLLDAGESAATAQEKTDKYAKRLLRYRAKLIARTETIGASANGVQAAWLTARDEGLLNPTQVQRKWIASVSSPRTCKICSELGQSPLVGLEEPFRSSVVGDVMLPPAHPNCRCSIGLVIK